MRIVYLKKLTLAIAFAFGLNSLTSSANESSQNLATPFTLISQFPINGVAEIISATHNGKYVFYTNAEKGTLDVVDVTSANNPRYFKTIMLTDDKITQAEPTSVVITTDDKYALVVIRTGDNQTTASSGVLKIFDISDINNIRLQDTVTLGVGPDSIDIVGENETLRAVIAIEDEETNDEGDALIPGVRAGSIDVVYLGGLYNQLPIKVQNIELVDALKSVDGIAYPEDPQPEFVSIVKGEKEILAAVTLQENNGVAIIDLTDPNNSRLKTIFSTGTVKREGTADIQKDKDILFKNDFEGRREADGVTWISDKVLAIANEGDTKKGDDGVLPGGRGFTIFDVEGNLLYETYDRTEKHAAVFGHYPDSRSAAKGVEIEGILLSEFTHPTQDEPEKILFVSSERGSFVEVYRVKSESEIEFLQLLPTGLSPEGLTTFKQADNSGQFFVTSNEKEGSLSIYQYDPLHQIGSPILQIQSTSSDLPWGALSGLAANEQNMYAVPDDVFAPSRFYKLAPNNSSTAILDTVKYITDEKGERVNLDLEGIALSATGIYFAAEGEIVQNNFIFKTDFDGKIMTRWSMPEEILNQFKDKEMKTGFEGVAVDNEEKHMFIALQRGFDAKSSEAQILHVDLTNGTWSSVSYPLDKHSTDADKYWTGLSDISLTNDNMLLVIERDKGGEAQGAIHAEIKRIYKVDARDVIAKQPIKKQLVSDLRKSYEYIHEKPEGIATMLGDIWIVNDNDGGGPTSLLRIPNTL